MNFIKPTLLFFTLIMVIPVFGQEISLSDYESKENLYEYHMARHKKLNRNGYIVLGSGIAAYVAGIVLFSNDETLSNEAVTGSLLMLGGLITSGASIPIFVSAGTNKKRAATFVQVGKHKGANSQFSGTKVVSIGVKIEL